MREGTQQTSRIEDFQVFLIYISVILRNQLKNNILLNFCNIKGTEGTSEIINIFNWISNAQYHKGKDTDRDRALHCDLTRLKQ